MKGLMRLGCFASLVSLLVTGCGGSSDDRPESITEPNVGGTPSLAQVYAYQTTAKSEQVLACSKLFLTSGSCDVANIKPIGADVTANVSIEDIKSRLVISHDWMAESFIAALEEMNDQDLLNLFKPLNSIVISYDVRPANYRASTVSIYLDPRYLWRNSEEWETIYQQDDYRDAFKTEFTFEAFRRYIDPSTNEYINWSNSYKAETYNSRTSAQIAPGLFRLLAHELAHANDFLPPALLSSLGNSGKIYDNYIYPASDINDELSESIPLNSSLLNEAAQIAFRGSTMTDRIRMTSALDAGSAFDGDGAADFYGYSTGAEDVAMLFEAFMMHKKYGAMMDVAFTTTRAADDTSCDGYVVKWGQRNRLADSSVKQRTIFAGSRLLARDITSELTSVSSAPINMQADIGWCSSLSQTTSVSGRSSNTASKTIQQVVYDYLDDKVRH